jgi:hydroxymethylbilane synthase
LGRGETGTAIAVEAMLPAPAQAAIGVECRTNDAMTAELLGAIDHRRSHRAVTAERIFTRSLGGTCHSPVGALAIEQDGELWLRGEILSEDGSETVAGEIRFACDDAGPPGALAHELLGKAPAAIRRLFEG